MDLSASLGTDQRARHEAQKLVEEIVAIVRSGTRFRVVLNREGGEVAVAETLHRAVVQIEMGELIFGIGEQAGLDGEAVVLGGDRDLAGGEVLDRVVRAAVSELQLERPSAAGQSHDL